MFTWCTREEWFDEFFDLGCVIAEHGSFASFDEAKADAEKHGESSGIVLTLD